MNSTTNNSEIEEQIRFVDYYQTPLNAGIYEVTATLTAPDVLQDANISTSTTVKLSVAGPRFFLPPSEIHSVFPPENGAGDYNNILPHIVLNRHTLPWERLVDEKVDDQHGTDTIKATQNNELEKIPFLALLVFSEDEENNGYDLNLMALNNATDLPSVGNGLVFVAKVGEFYHARIFDRTGAIVVGDGNSQFTPSPELAETLLMSFKGATIGPSIPVVDQTKRDIIRKITLSLGHPEANSDVTPLATVSLADLVTDLNFKYALDPGEKLTDKVSVIDVKLSLLAQIIPTGEELRLLAHGRELVTASRPSEPSPENGEEEKKHQRALIIANRLPAPPPQGDSKKRNIAHLVMLENRYKQDSGKNTWSFPVDKNTSKIVRLVCLKSWQFNCTADEPTLRGRLLSDAFTFEPLCVPGSSDNFEQIRLTSYAALPYHLRWGDRAHTLYHGPLVASAFSNNYPNKNAAQEISGATKILEAAKKALLDTESNDEKSQEAVEKAKKVLRQIVDRQIPASADSLVRILRNERIFDVSLAAAWQLGQMLMLRDQSTAIEYFSWRRRDAQLRARKDTWAVDGHLHLGDSAQTGLTALPKNVQDWCQKHLELRGLPFEYLIPDARMLPENSLRIFRIHETWMECFLSGALSVGRGGESDRILEVEYRSKVYPTSARVRTGFLLRSPAVDEHPDLKVVAEGTTSEIRLERIGPGLLLGLYVGTLSKLKFSLPPIGLHFGLKENANKPFSKDLKNRDGAGNKKSIDPIPMKTSPNDAEKLGGSIIDVQTLSQQMRSALESINPGSFAFQMCEGTEIVEFGVNTSSE